MFMPTLGVVLVIFAGDVVPDVQNVTIALGRLGVCVLSKFSRIVIGDGFSLDIFPGVSIVSILVDPEGLGRQYGCVLGKRERGSFESPGIVQGEGFDGYLGSGDGMLGGGLLVDDEGSLHDLVFMGMLSPGSGQMHNFFLDCQKQQNENSIHKYSANYQFHISWREKAELDIEMDRMGIKAGGRLGYNIIRRQMAYSGKKDYKPINDKAIIPLTLLQINNQLTEDSIFDGQSFYTLSIVGRLQSFRRENNSNMFLFSDGTGQLEGRINLTSGKMPAFAEQITFEQKSGEYFFVVFKPKFSEGERKFYIQMIKPVDNANTITKHFSDVILSSLVRKRNN